MHESSMRRQLMLGALACQMGLLQRDELATAVASWASDKTRDFGDYLVEQSLLSARDRTLLAPLATRHLERCNEEARSSDATLPAIPLLEELLQIAESGRAGPAIGISMTQDSHGSMPPTVPVGRPTAGGGRFRILRPHAEGGLGKVSVALDLELNREVALKEIRSSMAHDERARSRFLAEAEITGRLEHPGIVPVYGLGHFDDGRPYYAMRLIRGESMQRAIAKYHELRRRSAGTHEVDLELRKLLRRFIDICNAVEYAHSRGVLHRDLKPGNVMLGRYGETLVVDWGLAKPIDAEIPRDIDREPRVVPSSGSGDGVTVMGSAVGTPQYMSPEQAQGRLDLLGPRTDIYSLGAILFALLTGQPPIQATTRDEVLSRTSRSDFPKPRELNPRVVPALEAICLKAMARRREDRYESARAIVADVERWFADEPVTAYREPFRDAALRWARHHKTAVATVTVLLVCTLLALAIGNVFVARERDVARRQRDRANAARAAADRARRQAQENAAATREVIEKFLIEVGDDRWSKIPQFESVRIEMVGLAVEHYRRLVKQQPDNAALARDAATAFRRCANLYRMVAQFEKAADAYQQAETLMRRALAEKPEDNATKASLINLYGDAADLALRRNGPAAAENQYAKAYQLATAWHHDQPDSHRAAFALARIELDYGEVLASRGNYRKALELEQEAANLLGARADAAPSDVMSRLLTVFALNQIGMLARRAGDLQRADDALRESLRRARENLELNPKEPNFRYTLSWALLELATLRMQQNMAAAAREALDEALEMLTQLTTEHSTVASFQRKLAVAATRDAQLLLAARKTSDALTAADRAVAILDRLNSKTPAAIYWLPLIEAYHVRAQVRAELKDVDQARKDITIARKYLKTAKETNPSNPELAKQAAELDVLEEQL